MGPVSVDRRFGERTSDSEKDTVLMMQQLGIVSSVHDWLRKALAVPVLFAIVCTLAVATSHAAELRVHGEVVGKSGDPVSDAEVALYLNGRPYKAEKSSEAPGHAEVKHVTGKDGLFAIKVEAPEETILKGRWAIYANKPGGRSPKLRVLPKAKAQKSHQSDAAQYVTVVTVPLEREYGTAFWLSLAVLLGVYVLIALEVVHRTTSALVGAALILGITYVAGSFSDSYVILNWSQAIRAVDWNVIFLLMGMMIIVAALKASGFFQWLAYKTFQLAGGRTFVLAALLILVTAVLSAFLDNVTTMLLLAPVTMAVSSVLSISPITLLMPQIIASNFGGTATLIGDPPNIMIGSYAGLSFNDFLIALTPIVLITLAVQIVYSKYYYGYAATNHSRERFAETVALLKQEYRITDSRLLYISGSVLVVVIGMFVAHEVLHMEVCVAALIGAAAVLILTGSDVAKILEHDVEWTALIFFVMLFIVVGAAQETGLLELIADWIQRVCAGNLTLAILVILWASGILSAIVDNIPFTATMLPIIAYLNQTIPGAESGVLWWALSLGACFGGNGTLVGASANVVTASIAERAGHRITFGSFLKHGAPITFVSLVLASIYLILFW